MGLHSLTCQTFMSCEALLCWGACSGRSEGWGGELSTMCLVLKELRRLLMGETGRRSGEGGRSSVLVRGQSECPSLRAPSRGMQRLVRDKSRRLDSWMKPQSGEAPPPSQTGEGAQTWTSLGKDAAPLDLCGTSTAGEPKPVQWCRTKSSP